VTSHFGVRPNGKIRQRRGFRAAAAPVFQKRLSRNPTGGAWQRQPLKDRWIKPSIQVGSSGKGRRKFRVDDRVDGNRPMPGGILEFILLPGSQTGSGPCLNNLREDAWPPPAAAPHPRPESPWFS
jgi:hypothetical protein